MLGEKWPRLPTLPCTGLINRGFPQFSKLGFGIPFPTWCSGNPTFVFIAPRDLNNNVFSNPPATLQALLPATRLIQYSGQLLRIWGAGMQPITTQKMYF